MPLAIVSGRSGGKPQYKQVLHCLALTRVLTSAQHFVLSLWLQAGLPEDLGWWALRCRGIEQYFTIEIYYYLGMVRSTDWEIKATAIERGE